MSEKKTPQDVVYSVLCDNWPNADAILALSLMDIADEIVDGLIAADLLSPERENT